MRIFPLYLSLLRETFQERKKKELWHQGRILPTIRWSWTVSSVKCKWKSIFWQTNRMNRQIKWSPNVTGRIKISVVHISTYSLTTAVTIRSGWLITFCLWDSISIILLLFHWVAKNVLVGSKTKNTPPPRPALPRHFHLYLFTELSSGKHRNDVCRTLNINFFFWRGWGDCP